MTASPRRQRMKDAVLVLLDTQSRFTIPIGLFSFQSGYETEWNLVAAASFIGLVPVMAGFALLQRFFVAGRAFLASLCVALALPAAPADHRVPYGAEPLQFGELRLPAGAGPHPVAVVIHGGCWSSRYGLDHIGPASDALRQEGIATWTIEYRRVGDPGGGWRGTFEDVARGLDHVEALARRFPLDASRVVLVGHSAGGHLALWAAARHNLPASSPLRASNPLRIRGVVALAGIADLRAFGAAPGYCNAAVAQLLGGTAGEVPERYAEANPIELLPLRAPQRLVQGGRDLIVPPAQGISFAAEARRRGDDSQVRTIVDAGHFDFIDPLAPAWKTVVEEIRALLGPAADVQLVERGRNFLNPLDVAPRSIR